ncbi:MAG: sugar phosphate isomerase/epimerase [Verrucomicrobiales bacterium]|nr:sugar phosphate isomerase/epimerase [Verrucomicrobiales bacterium]MCP5559361.1 sugar phosphate isomerase/epimerase [Verrucomicrobiaceae bacterium]
MAADTTITPTPTAARSKLGIVIHSYGKRWHGKYSSVNYPPFLNALDVLDHVQSLGVAGLQTLVHDWTPEFAAKVRATIEGYGLYLEGSLSLPNDSADLGRFERDLRNAREAGATVFRSAMGGRRYEVFRHISEFQRYKETAWRSMQLAEPIARRLDVRIGIENHKDFQAAELAEMLLKLSSPHIGSCIDTGNSIALLEDPTEVVKTLAPFVVTTHIKDMAVQEYSDGFLLSEVPLGQGRLNIAQMQEICTKFNPSVTWNLEMITRDPLEIPCLTQGYWATFPDRPATDLARMLAWVRSGIAPALPQVKTKSTEATLAFEEANIVACMKAWGSHKSTDSATEAEQ